MGGVSDRRGGIGIVVGGWGGGEGKGGGGGEPTMLLADAEGVPDGFCGRHGDGDGRAF